jgi:hypothetical protein
MKKQQLNERVLNFKNLFFVLLVGIIFSMVKPEIVLAQGGTTLSGQAFVYLDAEDEGDTTGIIGENLYVKFYRLNGSNQLIFVAQAPINSEGYYEVTVYSNQDLYAIIPRNDVDDNFVTTFYPGWLDFESAEPLDLSGQDTIDTDWGAVGKEIVERPGGVITTIKGLVKTAVPLSNDFVPSVHLLDESGNLVESAPIGADGRYTLSFYSGGNFEVFTSIPGFTSQSKYISSEPNSRDALTVNFDLDVYKGESETTPSTVVAEKFNLTQNFPNPFNPTTNISFTVNTTGIVKLTVYNSLGKEVTKLVNDLVEPGTYDVTFNGQNLQVEFTTIHYRLVTT